VFSYDYVLEMWDWDKVGKDDFISTFTMPVSKYLNGELQEEKLIVRKFFQEFDLKKLIFLLIQSF
jgi:hypothetical protein